MRKTRSIPTAATFDRPIAVHDALVASTAADLARRCGLSTRTLERVFRAETGMRFGLWRQKAKLLESVRVLVERGSVTDAALRSGYSSVSAYISAFKQTFGCTPGAMTAGSPSAPGGHS